jgi:hypothetical protein
MTAPKSLFVANGNDQIAIQIECGDGGPADGGQADHPAILPSKVIGPPITTR